MLLAIETSAHRGSVALLEDNRIVSSHLGTPRDHGAHLAPAVAELLKNRSAPIAAYAFSAGPGSFAGLRVGLAFVKGLACSRPAPVASISSLRVRAATLAQRRSIARPILVVLDARRAGVYAGLFAPQWPHEARPELPLAAYPLEEFRTHPIFEFEVVAGGDGLTVVGDVSPKWDVVRSEEAEPEAEVLALLGGEAIDRGEGRDPHLVEPAYLVRSAPEERRNAETYPMRQAGLTNREALSTFGAEELDGGGQGPAPRSIVHAKRDSE